MLSSIHPLGERTRNNNWTLTVGAYVVGSALGGTALGALAGALGWPLVALLGFDVRVIIVVIAAVAGLVVELARKGQPLPSWHRQVNEDWLGTYRGWVYGLGFGLQLGLGVVTYITTVAVYVTIITAMLAGPLLGSVFIGLVFGLTRGLLILAGRGIDHPDRLRQFHRELAEQAAPVRLFAGGSLGLAAGFAALLLVVG